MTVASARTQKRWEAMLNSDKEQRRAKFAAALNGPSEKLNSQKEPVPSAPVQCKTAEQQENEALLRLADGDKEKAEILRQAIAKQTAERYASAVALDNAMNAVLRRREGMLDKLTPEYVAMRQGIKCTPELLEYILQQVAQGVSVYKLCRRDDMPTQQSVSAMLNSAEWLQKYQAAMFQRADKQVEEIEDASRELAAAVAAGADANVVNAIKVHINTLQWIAARINPAKYGDRQTVDMNATVKLTETQVDERLRALMNKAGVDLAAMTAADPDRHSS